MRASSSALCLLGSLVMASCANLTIPIAYLDGHLEKIVKVAEEGAIASTEGTVVARQFKILHFQATEAKEWSEAMVDHKGSPSEPIVVPQTPDDTREIVEENRRKRRYKAEVAVEKKIKAIGKGWLKGLLGGGAGLGGTGLLALLWQKRRKLLTMVQRKDKALDQYHTGVDRLSKKARNAFEGAELKVEHDVRKNGGA